MIEVDGAQGEGGGQILRTALSLSLCTGQSFRMDGIRARRSRPGLMRQHLTAVAAAARVANARVEGALLGSRELTFTPDHVRPGDYEFDVGTAGSTTLVLQTVLPALLIGDQPCRLRLRGGTHNPQAPPFEFLQRAFLPLLARMGVTVGATLERYGFFPAGGGRIHLDVTPCKRLAVLHLPERGALLDTGAEAVVAQLPAAIAARELAVVEETLGVPPTKLCTLADAPSDGRGNVLLIWQQYQNVCEVFTGFGERGVPAEQVARRAVALAQTYARSGAAVGEHLADQLLLPMALCGAGSFGTVAPSSHTRTNIEVIRTFLPVRFRVEQRDAQRWTISVERA